MLALLIPTIRLLCRGLGDGFEDLDLPFGVYGSGAECLSRIHWSHRGILGLYRDSGKENENYYLGFGV